MINAAIKSMIQEALDEDEYDRRAELLDRYLGENYGDEVEGRSSFVSTDCGDAVEAMLPNILEPFVGAEEVVAFDAVGPEDEEAARQETDTVSHIFWDKNNGFLTLYNVAKEALIGQVAYVEAEWSEREKVTVEEYSNLSPEEFQQIVMDLNQDAEELTFPELEGFDRETGQYEIQSVDPMTGEMQFAPINVTIRCVKMVKEYKINSFPNEEFFHTPRWPSIDLEGIPCCGRRFELTRGELLEMGFEEACLDELTDEDGDEDFQEQARHDTSDHSETDSTQSGDDSSKRLTVYKTFCRLDINDDGKAELVRVWAARGGNKILRWENGEEAIDEVSGLPFSAFTPYIVPHRHAGRSVVEQVEDIAKVKTVLYRHTLDNVYSMGNVRPIVAEDGVTADTFPDLERAEHGAPIRVRNQGAVQYQAPPSVIQTTLPLLQRFDDQMETRTGATRYNQGMDSESLNKTATGMSMIMDASMKRHQMIARIFAETFLRRLFLIIHRDLRNGPLKDMAMKLRGQWVQVNPRTWSERTDMTVSVGMGSGDRDQRRQGLMLLSANLEKLAMDPEVRESGLVGYEQFRALAEDAMGTYGFRSIDRYMPPPEQAQPKQPDPMAEQMKEMQQRMMMLQAQNAEMQLQLQQAELRKRLVEAQMAPQIIQADLQNDAAEIELKRDKMILDDDFKRDKLAVDAETAHNRKFAGEFNDTPPMSYGQVG